MTKIRGFLQLIAVDYLNSIKGTKRPWLLKNKETGEISQLASGEKVKLSELQEKYETVIPVVIVPKSIERGSYFMHLDPITNKLSVHQCSYRLGGAVETQIKRRYTKFPLAECRAIMLPPSKTPESLINLILSKEANDGTQLEGSIAFWSIASKSPEIGEVVVVKELPIYSESECIEKLTQYVQHIAEAKGSYLSPMQWLKQNP